MTFALHESFDFQMGKSYATYLQGTILIKLIQ